MSAGGGRFVRRLIAAVIVLGGAGGAVYYDFNDAPEAWDKAFLVADIDGRGIRVLDLEPSEVRFNIDGDEFGEKVAWIVEGDAFLAEDRNRDGRISGSHELFDKRERHDFRALFAMDRNGDDRIDASEADFGVLGLWQDGNGNGKTDPRELKSFADFGAAALELDSWFNSAFVPPELARFSSAILLENGRRIALTQTAIAVDQRLSHYLIRFPYEPELEKLPFCLYSGDLVPFYAAMIWDPELRDRVESFTQLSEKDFAGYYERIEAILYRWAEVEDIDPTSRGAFADARHLAYLEKAIGQSLRHLGFRNPFWLRGRNWEARWQNYFYSCAGMLLFLGPMPLKAFFPELRLSEDNNFLLGRVNFAQTVGRFRQSAPADKRAAAAYWDAAVLLIDAVALEMRIARELYDPHLEGAIQGQGLGYSLEELRAPGTVGWNGS